MLTQKDFKAVAEIIDNEKLTQEDFVSPYDERAQGVADGINIIRQAIGEKLADYFTTQNPHFDCERFLAACGLGD